MALGRDVLEGKKRGEFDIFGLGDTSLSDPKPKDPKTLKHKTRRP